MGREQSRRMARRGVWAAAAARRRRRRGGGGGAAGLVLRLGLVLVLALALWLVLVLVLGRQRRGGGGGAVGAAAAQRGGGTARRLDQATPRAVAEGGPGGMLARHGPMRLEEGICCCFFVYLCLCLFSTQPPLFALARGHHVSHRPQQ